MAQPRVLVVNNGTLSLPQLRRRFEELGSATDAVDAVSVPARLDGRYQAIVLSGTKVRAYDQEHYKPLIDLVTPAVEARLGHGAPLLGVRLPGGNRRQAFFADTCEQFRPSGVRTLGTGG